MENEIAPLPRVDLAEGSGGWLRKVCGTAGDGLSGWLGRLARSSRLRGEVTREAIHEEGEECRGLGAEADAGVGRTGHDLRQALGGDIQAHGPGGAELGFEDGGGGDGVEEYRRGGVVPGMGTPFGIEGLERRGEGGVRGEKLLPVSAVQGYLGGVEGKEANGDAGGEDDLGAGRVLQDIPLGGGRSGACVGGEVSLTDGAAHEDDASELAHGGRVAVDGGGDVEERTDGQQGESIAVLMDGGQQRGDGVGMAARRKVLGVGALGEEIGGGGGQPGIDRNVDDVRGGEEVIEEASAEIGVAEGGGDADDANLRAAQQKSDGEGIVDVVADIGVDPDQSGGRGQSVGRDGRGWLRGMGLSLGRGCMQKQAAKG